MQSARGRCGHFFRIETDRIDARGTASGAVRRSHYPSPTRENEEPPLPPARDDLPRPVARPAEARAARNQSEAAARDLRSRAALIT
jgi:hypothetical protein